MLGQEGGHQGRHVKAAEACWRRDGKMAGGIGAAFGNGSFGIFQISQDALATFQKGRAFMG